MACAECKKEAVSQYEHVRGDDEARRFFVDHRSGALELCMV